ncbi:MAG: glycogen synthase [Capsulimonadaceae bacterium]
MGKRILLVSAELAGVAPIGGVAEYILGLASSLQLAGHDVRIALPRYGFLQARNPETVIPDLIVWRGYPCEHHTRVQSFFVPNLTDPDRRLPVILVGQHPHFDGVMKPEYVHTGPGQGPEPWEEFSRAVVDYVLAVQQSWDPDVIHCHDAHTALVPAYIHQLKHYGTWRANGCRTVLTVHNLLYQGKGGGYRFWYAGLDDMVYGSVFSHNGETNAFKAGLYLADVASTVSYTYRNEICDTSAVGFGLEGVLGDLRQHGRLRGIVNGINESRWCVGDLPYYHATSTSELMDQRQELLAAKQAAKRDLLQALDWPESDISVPIVSMRGRWDDQKGFYPFIDSLESMARTTSGRILDWARVLLVTWGEPDLGAPMPDNLGDPEPVRRSRHYWGTLLDLASRRPDRIKVNPPILAGAPNLGRHYLASDFFIVPSRYEPCGLIQMECQRFGTIPIVRRTGGLADTVAECATPMYPSPNGFTFEGFHWGDLTWAVKRAVDRYYGFQNGHDDYLGWMIDNALLQQNSWDARVPQYESLYGFT